MKYILIQYAAAIFLSIVIFVVCIYENEYNVNVNSNVQIQQYFKLSFKYQWPVIRLYKNNIGFWI